MTACCFIVLTYIGTKNESSAASSIVPFHPKNGLKNRQLSYWATSQKNSVSIPRYTLFPLLSSSTGTMVHILLFLYFLTFSPAMVRIAICQETWPFFFFSLFSKREILLGLSLVNRQKKTLIAFWTPATTSATCLLYPCSSMIQGYTYCTWIQMLLLPCSWWHLQAQWRSRANLPPFFPWPSQKLDWGRVKEIGRYYVKGIADCLLLHCEAAARAYQHPRKFFF